MLSVLLLPSTNTLGHTPPDREVAAKTAGDDAWSALGTGVAGEVKAIAISGTEIYVGGTFTHAGGQAAHGIAKYSSVSYKVRAFA